MAVRPTFPSSSCSCRWRRENDLVQLLVVEDEPRMAALLARGLREEGYAVETSGDGREALGLLLSSRYDAVVLDVMLPGIDGLEVCRRLRAAGIGIPVLML